MAISYPPPPPPPPPPPHTHTRTITDLRKFGEKIREREKRKEEREWGQRREVKGGGVGGGGMTRYTTLCFIDKWSHCINKRFIPDQQCQTSYGIAVNGVLNFNTVSTHCVCKAIEDGLKCYFKQTLHFNQWLFTQVIMMTENDQVPVLRLDLTRMISPLLGS